MTATMTARMSDADQRAGLSDRLNALDRLVQAGSVRSGPDGISEELLSQAEDVLTNVFSAECGGGTGGAIENRGAAAW